MEHGTWNMEHGERYLINEIICYMLYVICYMLYVISINVLRNVGFGDTSIFDPEFKKKIDLKTIII